MKKIYTLALAAAVCVSAGAATRQQISSTALTPSHSASAKNAVMEKLANAGLATTPHKAPARAASLVDLEGTYEWTYTALLSVMPTSSELVLSVEDEATGTVTLSGFVQDYVVKATVDLAAGTLTIANDQNLGPDSYGDVNYFYLKPVVNGQVGDGKSTAESSVGTISGTTITFPAMDIWTIADYNDESLGYWWASCANTLTLVEEEDPDKDPNEGWTSLGQATFQDGWVLPCFGLDQTDEANWYKVELQQNDENENLYRLVDPYFGNFPLADYNTSTASHGYIVFDITDPDYVVFEDVDAAFANSQLGLSKFYPMNTLSWAVGYFGYDASTIIAVLGDQLQYTTYADGILTLPATYGPVEDSAGNTTEKWSNDACFGLQGDVFAGYGWQDNTGATINMETRIAFPGHTFSGVSSAIADRNDAPVEYFNLQGSRLTAPAAGTIVIKRQGDTVSKVYVK